MRQHTDTVPSTNPNVNLVDHFTVHLRALNRSAKIIETYLDSVKQFVELVDAQGMPPQPMNWKREHRGFAGASVRRPGVEVIDNQ